MYGYRRLMQEIYADHQKFSAEFNKWWNDNSRKKKTGDGRWLEPETLTKARNELIQKLGILYETKLEPLEKKLHDEPNSAIDEIIEFLAIDIPAFRCGYAKGVFLQKLKNVELRAADAEKIRQIAIQYCETKNVRREFRRWCRLMIELADARFVSRLESNLESDNNFARFKSRWMLEMINQQRVDLRKTKNK